MISTPQFPNVPALPGVPLLARMQTSAQVRAGATVGGFSVALAAQLGLPSGVTFGTNALFSGLGLSPLGPQQQVTPPDSSPDVASAALPRYGITAADGSAAISPDSAIELSLSADSDLNSHPVEQGGFQDYNRVQEPISIRLLLACQGVNMSRSTFLSRLASLREGTDIVTVSVPDAAYPNMVLKSYGYKRSAENGAVTIWADTQWLEERSTNVTVGTPATSQPQGAATSNLGSLSPADPTSQQLASIYNPAIVPVSLPPDYSLTAPPSGIVF